MILLWFNSNTNGVAREAGTIYPYGPPEFTPDFRLVAFVLLDL